MALTAAEQAEMAQLQKEVGHLEPQPGQMAQPQAKGLSPAERAEMAQLQKEVGHLDKPNYRQMANLDAHPNVSLPGVGNVGPVGLDKGMRPTGEPIARVPSGYDVASKYIDNPYLGTAVSTAYDAAPLALGLLGGKGAQVAEEGAVAQPKGIINQKPNAPAISEAAKRLGAEASPGMLSADPVVAGLEDSLSQAPTIGGYLARKKTGPIQEALSSTTKGLLQDASALSPYETGEKAKQLLSGEIERRFSEPKRLFNELSEYTKDIPSTPKSTNAVSKNIMNIPDVSVFEDGPAASIAKSVTKALGNNPSVDQIKTLRTMVGKRANALEANQQPSDAVWDIYHKLGKLEENTLKRGVISSARTQPEGNNIAQGMLGQLKAAKKGYSSEMSNLGDLSQATNLGNVRTPNQLSDKINAIKSENLQEKMLPFDDVRAGKQLFQYSPETADLLRRARLRDVADRASNMHRDVTPSGLIRTLNNFNPETEKLLFGKQQPTLEDLRTIMQSLPEKIGPSGTPKGHAYSHGDMLSPRAQLRDLLKYHQYSNASAPMREVGPLEMESLDPMQGVLLDYLKRARLGSQHPQAATSKKDDVKVAQ